MKNIHKWFGKEKRLSVKFGLLSLFFLCLAGRSPGQECTITPANPITCFGSSSFNLNYTSTGSPDQYSLTAGPRAMPGFSAVTNASLVGSPVIISIPNSVAAGDYDFTIVVNSLANCGPSSALFILTIADQFTFPAVPSLSTTPASCSAAGTTVISNYVAGTTYTFTPAGPTVGVAGAITGATLGTSYTVTAGNGSCSSGPSASFTNAAQLTVPSILSLSTTPTSSVCPGATTTLTANGVAGTNALVTWWTAAGGTGTNLGTGLTLTNRGSGTYFARVTGDCGSAVETSLTVTSKVNVTITSATATANSVCPGGTTTLTANGVAGTNALVTWWTAAGGTGTNLGTGLTLTNRGPGTYFARVTGDCGSAVETSVTVTPKVNVAITSATATANSVCPGVTTTLTANGVAGTNVLVTWWTAAGGTGTNLGTGLTLTNRGSGT
ncbi:MAG: hypothetical protein GZ094_09535, partial [Mariniphaga sp.]|nr:hypothetical protein [Mariniphaga sp.]